MTKISKQNYFINGTIRLLLRMLAMSCFFYLVTLLNVNNFDQYEEAHAIIGACYYIVFFICAERYLKFSNTASMVNISKWFSVMKWLFLITTFVLVFISSNLVVANWPDSFVDKMNYWWVKVWPFVFGPNISFVIISLLVFYTSNVIGSNISLQQEQDLTI